MHSFIFFLKERIYSVTLEFWMHAVFYEFVLAGDYICSALLSSFNNRGEIQEIPLYNIIISAVLLFLVFWGAA